MAVVFTFNGRFRDYLLIIRWNIPITVLFSFFLLNYFAVLAAHRILLSAQSHHVHRPYDGYAFPLRLHYRRPLHCFVAMSSMFEGFSVDNATQDRMVRWFGRHIHAVCLLAIDLGTYLKPNQHRVPEIVTKICLRTKHKIIEYVRNEHINCIDFTATRYHYNYESSRHKYMWEWDRFPRGKYNYTHVHAFNHF